MDLDKLKASDGTGEAVQAIVTVLRNPGSTVLTPDSLVNWPTDFVATTGPLLANGTLDPAKALVFRGHISGATIVIDELAPGYTDTYGSAVGDVVVLKPTTWWADTLVDTIAVSHNADGTIKNNAVTTAMLADSNVTTAKIADGSVTNAKLSTAAGEPGAAWQSWTPTLTNCNVGTGGNATRTGWYIQIGKTVHFRLQCTLGTSGQSVTGTIASTLPITPSTQWTSLNEGFIVGFAKYLDASTASYKGYVQANSSGGITFIAESASSSYVQQVSVNGTIPFTWGAGDTFLAAGTYEAA